MNTIETFLHKTLDKMGVELDDYDRDLGLADDLGMESLMRKELAAKMQRKFKVQIGEKIEDLETIGELVDYVANAAEPAQQAA